MKKTEVARKIKGATDAIISGVRLQSVQDELARLEQEHETVKGEISQVEADIATGTIHRPSVEQVQSTWSSVTQAWETATEDERKWLIQRLVKRVEVTEKHRASLRLTSIIETPGAKFVPAVQVGAGREVIANHFPLLILDSPLLCPDRMRGLARGQALGC